MSDSQQSLGASASTPIMPTGNNLSVDTGNAPTDNSNNKRNIILPAIPLKPNDNGHHAFSHNHSMTTTDRASTSHVHLASLDGDEQYFTGSYVRSFTPRSKEALKQTGILPHDLIIRPLEAFQEPGLHPEIQKIRYTDYDTKRKDFLALARRQRQLLIASNWQPRTGSPLNAWTECPSALSANSTHRAFFGANSPAGNSRPVTPGFGQSPLHTSNRSPSAAAVSPSHAMSPLLSPVMAETEQQRIEKILKRQNKELESMMAYEVKIAELVARQEEKIAWRHRLEEERKKQRQAARADAQAKKRMMEQKRQEEEARAAEERKKAADHFHEQEEKFQEMQKEKEAQRQDAARKRAIERQMKKKELKERTKMIWQEQQSMLQEKARLMAEREEQRKQQLEEAKAKMSEEHAKKEVQAKLRAKLVVHAHEEQNKVRAFELEQKIEAQRRRQQQMEEEKRRQVEEMHHIQAQKEARRQSIRRVLGERTRNQLVEIQEKEKSFELNVAKLEQKRKEEEMVKREMQRLQRDRKRANQERLMRAEAYRRAELADKVETDFMRARLLEMQKQAQLQERQKIKLAASIYKQQVMKTFEQLRVTKAWRHGNNPAAVGSYDSDPQLGYSSSSPQLPSLNKYPSESLLPKALNLNAFSGHSLGSSASEAQLRVNPAHSSSVAPQLSPNLPTYPLQEVVAN